MVRRKERYFVCEVVFPGAVAPLGRDAVLSALRDAVQTCHGAHGMAVLETERGVVRIKHVNDATKLVIFRCLRLHHRLFWSSLAFVSSLGGVDAFFNTIHVAATLKAVEKFVVAFHKRKLVDSLDEAKTMEERKEIQGLIIEACSQ